MNALRWILARAATIGYRNAYFWGGLLLLWAGVAGRWSPGLASVITGSVLVFVAVFGVAPGRAS